MIAIELRDTESRQIQIDTIDYEKNILLSSYSTNIDWWSGLSAISNGCIIIQNFKDATFPEPKGFIVFDTLNQKEVLRNKDSAFAFCSENRLISTRIFFSDIIYESYNLSTGLKEESEVDSLKDITPEKVNISLPLQYNEGNIHFSTINRFIKNCLNQDAVLAVEYLETDSLIMVSYYIRGLEKLENFLLLTDLEGMVIEDILISSDLEGISKETFFVKDNHLYFVKNKKELQRYEL